MKVLVVEDDVANAITAMQFFNSKDVEAVIVSNVETAVQKLQEEVFLAAILDVEIPRGKGANPERLGPEVGKVAKEGGVPYVYLTGYTPHGHGHHHGHGPQAMVFLDEVCLEKGQGETVPAKSSAEAWAKAWEILQSTGNLEEIYNARVRYKKYTGKMYKT